MKFRTHHLRPIPHSQINSNVEDRRLCHIGVKTAAVVLLEYYICIEVFFRQIETKRLSLLGPEIDFVGNTQEAVGCGTILQLARPVMSVLRIQIFCGFVERDVITTVIDLAHTQ